MNNSGVVQIGVFSGRTVICVPISLEFSLDPFLLELGRPSHSLSPHIIVLNMSDTYASPTEVAPLVANVIKAADAFETATGGDQHGARRTLQLEARKLLYALEEPNTEVWPRIYQVNVSTAVEILSDLKLWDLFEGGKSVSMTELLELTKVDEIILSRFPHPCAIFRRHQANMSQSASSASSRLRRFSQKLPVQALH